MQASAISGEYEKNTGTAIVQAFQNRDPMSHPGVLVANHGPFAWGATPTDAAHNAVVLEALARMAYFTIAINNQAGPISQALHDRHFLRKHGRTAYYGQTGQKK
jgi:L-ribulose-5-phosphate 4-epimerase